MSRAADDALYLIDATSQLFRAYFAIRGLTNDQGLPTNAVFGFTTMMRKLLREENPAYVAAAFDLGGEVFRHEAYADYKANRPPAPEDLSVQVPYAKQACEILGVSVLECRGFEADDLIATFTRIAREQGRRVVVVASDKDLLQLVRDGVEVLNPSRDVRLDSAAVAEWFGVPPERVVDVLALMGDSVDNIPGVPGVGEKTAVALVGTYGTLDAVLERAERFVRLYDARDALLEAIGALGERGDGPDPLAALRACGERCRRALAEFATAEADPAMRGRAEALAAALDRAALDGLDDPAGAARAVRELKRELKGMDRASSRRIWYAVREHADAARLSRELARLREDVPVDADLERFRRGALDRARALAFFRALDFRSLADELETPPTTGAAVSSPAPGAPEPRPAQPAPSGTGVTVPETIADAARLEALAVEIRAAGRLAVRPVLDGPDPLRAGLTGLGLAWGEGRAAWIPLGDDEGLAPAFQRVGQDAVLGLASRSRALLHRRQPAAVGREREVRALRSDVAQQARRPAVPEVAQPHASADVRMDQASRAHPEVSSAVLVHQAADVDVGRRDVLGRDVRPRPHHRLAAALGGPSLEPVDPAAVDLRAAESQRARDDAVRAQLRGPASVRADLPRRPHPTAQGRESPSHFATTSRILPRAHGRLSCERGRAWTRPSSGSWWPAASRPASSTRSRAAAR